MIHTDSTPTPHGMPVAYIRRSVARRSDPGDVSREFQTARVRALANGDGPTLRIIDADWGRSAATDKTDKRLAFLALLDQIERGEVSTLYAFSADRLARSVRWAAQLLDGCQRAGTTIVTSEGRFAPGDAGAVMLFQMLAVMNENALRGMVEKSGQVASTRKARGDAMGRAPYGWRNEIVDADSPACTCSNPPRHERHSCLVRREDENPQVVMDAFRATGTYGETARLLNAAAGEIVTADDGRVIGVGIGLATRFGKRWDPTVVRNVIRREAPDMIPPRPRRGAQTRATRMFAGLLQCPHVHLHPASPAPLTSQPTKFNPRYLCRVGRFDPAHPRPYIVSEAKVLDWARAEVARLGQRLDATYADDLNGTMAARVSALEAKRERILDMYADGDIDKAEKNRRLAAIDAEMPALQSTTRAVQSFRLKGFVDWDADPAEVNARLRELWQRVELDPVTMLPVRAVWAPGLSPEEQEAKDAATEERTAQAYRDADGTWKVPA